MATALKVMLNSSKPDGIVGRAKVRIAKGLALKLLVALMVIGIGAGFYFYHAGRPVQVPPTITEQPPVVEVVKNGASSVTSALFRIESEPAGAEVFLDSEPLGKTPLMVSVPMGDHSLQLRLDNFYVWQEQIKVTEPGEIPISVRLKPIIF